MSPIEPSVKAGQNTGILFLFYFDESKGWKATREKKTRVNEGGKEG